MIELNRPYPYYSQDGKCTNCGDGMEYHCGTYYCKHCDIRHHAVASS